MFAFADVGILCEIYFKSSVQICKLMFLLMFRFSTPFLATVVPQCNTVIGHNCVANQNRYVAPMQSVY